MKRALIAVFALILSAGAGAQDRAEQLVKKMTLEEKCTLISGQIDEFHTFAIPRLGIPSVRFADGSQGVRNSTRSTYYPCELAVAATWNREAALRIGEGIGRDAAARGVAVMLCPAVNIYRNAHCGRNFEYMGEDPYLAGEQSLQYILGVQGQGVIATIKHFALNNQEYDRHNVGSLVDERTKNEIYFPAFRKAIEHGNVGAVMTSYPPVEGTHAAENAPLIKGNLRAWGFDGIVMSDWGSTYSPIGCATSGLDLEMPKGRAMNYKNLKPLIDKGIVLESEIDEKCIHILRTLDKFGFLDKALEEKNDIPSDPLCCEYAYKVALESPVLLKNEGILPLRRGRIALVGPNADKIPTGGGCGEVEPIEGTSTTLYQGLKALGKKYDVTLHTDLFDQKTLRRADAIIVALGFDRDSETETKDRTYALPAGQDSLVLAAAQINPNIVVLVNSGGEVDVMPWLDKAKALMMAWYGGQEGGKALAAILSGQVSPSGRLPFTFWGSEAKNPSSTYYEQYTGVYDVHPRERFKKYAFTMYSEGIFIGYRGVEKGVREPLYPFGYGLSYSSFEYSDAVVTPSGDGYDVSFSIRNSGKCTASEVAQLYVSPLAPSVVRPERELKGYGKIELASGTSGRITVHLGPDAFSYYDTASHCWKKDPGRYKILVGSSSSDIRLEIPLVVE